MSLSHLNYNLIYDCEVLLMFLNVLILMKTIILALNLDFVAIASHKGLIHDDLFKFNNVFNYNANLL